jgi:hypothetical protein
MTLKGEQVSPTSAAGLMRAAIEPRAAMPAGLEAFWRESQQYWLSVLHWLLVLVLPLE